MPCTIICSDDDRPERTRPLVSVPMIRLPTKAPTTLPSPPKRRVPANDHGGDHGQQVLLAERVVGTLEPARVEDAGERGRRPAQHEHGEFHRSTRIPIARAAPALSPVATTWRAEPLVAEEELAEGHRTERPEGKARNRADVTGAEDVDEALVLHRDGLEGR